MVTGSGDKFEKLDQESGGHRIQRVPPNEKRGRVHTSTVTVFVHEENSLEKATSTDEESRFKNACECGVRNGSPKSNKRARKVSSVTRDLQETKKAQNTRVEWFSGTGKGGQNRNKVQNSVRLHHEETGIIVTSQTRSRKNSLKDAEAELSRRLNELKSAIDHDKMANMKKIQVGSGMRGDKIRTYRFQDDRVKDHRSEKECSCLTLLDGNFDKMWK